MANKLRKCCYCKERSPLESGILVPAGFFCSHSHAIEYANQYQNKQRERQIQRANKERTAKQREERKQLTERKEALRPRSWYMKEAQKWFNKFIRLRDKDEPCICCGRDANANVQWHAGHFLTTGARPEHRFNEDNCHKQTSYCNNHLSGNVAEYRKRLINKIGQARVEAVEQDHKPKNYTIDDLKDIIQTYKQKCKQLEIKSPS